MSWRIHWFRDVLRATKVLYLVFRDLLLLDSVEHVHNKIFLLLIWTHNRVTYFFCLEWLVIQLYKVVLGCRRFFVLTLGLRILLVCHQGTISFRLGLFKLYRWTFRCLTSLSYLEYLAWWPLVISSWSCCNKIFQVSCSFRIISTRSYSRIFPFWFGAV